MLHATTDVSCFRSKEQVRNELCAVDDCEDPVDPAIIPCLVSDESHNKRTPWWTKCDHQCPDAYVFAALIFEECLGDHATADRDSRADEKGTEGSAYRHAGVCMTESAADVEEQRANGRYQPYWTATISVREWLPEKRGESQHRDLKGCEVGCALDRATQVFTNILVCRNDRRSNESRHHSVEGNADEVGEFLPLRPIVPSSRHQYVFLWAAAASNLTDRQDPSTGLDGGPTCHAFVASNLYALEIVKLAH
jgi:hypothetical protein